MADISSVKNQQVKDWKKLHARKERKKQNRYLIEGFHLIEEALRFNKNNIQLIIVREGILEDTEFSALPLDGLQITTVSAQVADEMSETETNQGIFAVLKMDPMTSLKQIKGPFLLLDGVQDPGNVGTMIRTADAAGFQGVVLGKGTADLYNSKTMRAAQGSHFHIECYEGDLEAFMTAFNHQNITVYGTMLDETAESYKTIQEDGLFALIVGNEGAGIREELVPYIDKNIYIPIKGEAESLNVAIAASILMFYLN